MSHPKLSAATKAVFVSLVPLDILEQLRDASVAQGGSKDDSGVLRWAAVQHAKCLGKPDLSTMDPFAAEDLQAMAATDRRSVVGQVSWLLDKERARRRDEAVVSDAVGISSRYPSKAPQSRLNDVS